MDTRSMAVMGLIIGALTVPSVGIAASPSQQGGTDKQSQAKNPTLDQNAELGKGHLGPQDGTPKGGTAEDQHRQGTSAQGQGDPHAIRGAGGKPTPSGKSADVPPSNMGGQGAVDQGIR
jgi:hypothetical protein